jgi:hypothetical protein
MMSHGTRMAEMGNIHKYLTGKHEEKSRAR